MYTVAVVKTRHAWLSSQPSIIILLVNGKLYITHKESISRNLSLTFITCLTYLPFNIKLHTCI